MDPLYFPFIRSIRVNTLCHITKRVTPETLYQKGWRRQSSTGEDEDSSQIGFSTCDVLRPER